MKKYNIQEGRTGILPVTNHGRDAHAPLKFLTLVLIVLMLFAGTLSAQVLTTPTAVPKFDAATVDTFRKIAVQDGGRVKPLDTLARFMLLRFNGKQSFTTPDGVKISPMEWLLHCMFYPEVSDTYPHFIVDDSAVITSIGAKAHEDKRDRYSLEEISVGHKKLFELAEEYNRIEAKERKPIEQQVLNLANNVFEYNQVSHYLQFAGQRFKVEGDSTLAAAFPEPEGVSLSEAALRMQRVMQELRTKSGVMAPEQLNLEVTALSDLMGQMRNATSLSFGLKLLPPADAEIKEWRSVSDLAGATQEFAGYTEDELALLASMERLPDLREDRIAFLQEAKTLQSAVEKLAATRGEYAKIPLEVTYYKNDFFFRAQWLFMLAFVIFSVTLLLPHRPWIYWGSYALVIPPLFLVITGITLRCIIRSRPPISTLYETILFITAVCVTVALFLEFINRQRIALAVAPVLGFLGMVIAYRYEAKEAVDTMPSLVAVLDTNFWLMIHVTTINIGYAAAFLSGALAHVYIIGRLLKIKNTPKTYRGMTRMVYGVLCFGLVFSVVGTVLGGIWANDSWGRFWGWDPKENGALMICIWALVVLHARMGGYIRDLGINMGAVVLSMITAFSWWGVNLLGVGLHSYGFTSGIMNLLVAFWALEVLMLIIAAGVWFRDDYSVAGSGEKAQSPQVW